MSHKLHLGYRSFELGWSDIRQVDAACQQHHHCCKLYIPSFLHFIQTPFNSFYTIFLLISQTTTTPQLSRWHQQTSTNTSAMCGRMVSLVCIHSCYYSSNKLYELCCESRIQESRAYWNPALTGRLAPSQQSPSWKSRPYQNPAFTRFPSIQ